MKKIAFFWRTGFWTLLSLSFVLLVAFIVMYAYLESQLPDVESLKTVQLQVPLQVYTQDGRLIQEYGEKKRIPIAYKNIPPLLIKALLATEDQRFFEHPGVDLLGLGRAMMSVIQTGSKSQGGSTITMQVARNFFLNRKKTFLRKFNEILLAIKIDRELSKEKILELYLNKIYLGNRAYGVGAAAQVYFGKNIGDLTLSELAMIAGLPQAPSTQNPIVNKVAAKKRRDHVLLRLLEEHYISQNQYDAAKSEPISAKYHGVRLQVHAPYVAEMIRQSLYNHFGPEAYTRGYKVFTTLKGNLQIAANEVVENNLLAYERRHGYRGPMAHLSLTNKEPDEVLLGVLGKYPIINDLLPAMITSVEEQSATALTVQGRTITLPWSGLSWAKAALRKGYTGHPPLYARQVVQTGDVVYVRYQDEWQLVQVPQVEGALVTLNPHNGAIEALVGGLNFEKSKFNRATQASRQPGSSFKPFIYAAALNKGYTLATMVNDAPIVVENASDQGLWRPHNDNRKFSGPTRLKDALIRSRNMVSIRVLDDIGIDYAIDFLSHFGFQKQTLPNSLSLALGSLSVSPLDLAAAYSVFANGGYKIEPYLIDHISDSEGHVILQAKPSEAQKEASVEADVLAPRVISGDIAYLMHTALKDVIRIGTARTAMVLNRNDLAGKTGTTNDQVDSWFAGYNPELVTVTWIGYDTPTPLYEYAKDLALPLWIDFMRIALKDIPEHDMIPPENVIPLQINPKTGLLAQADVSNTMTEYFIKDNVPSMEDAATIAANSSTETEQENLF